MGTYSQESFVQDNAQEWPMQYSSPETEYVDLTETDWFKETKSKTTPGEAMRIYRDNQQLTQAQLGEKLGNVPRQIISNMERGRRSISLATAKKLAVIFNVPASRFLEL
jgi:DNA-binding XRE family transcriptional regulator